MLSIGKIGGGNGDPSYYLDAVASGQEDYYTGSGEAPGTWVGRGAAARGLEGRVEDDTFLRVLDSTDGNNNKSVLAYDLTFSAPACWTRRGRNADGGVVGGARRLLAQGEWATPSATWSERLTFAAFRHRSSRAGDPQLHTHAVVANATIADGRATTLDGRALKQPVSRRYGPKSSMRACPAWSGSRCWRLMAPRSMPTRRGEEPLCRAGCPGVRSGARHSRGLVISAARN